jgi:hypothetical protein
MDAPHQTSDVGGGAPPDAPAPGAGADLNDEAGFGEARTLDAAGTGPDPHTGAGGAVRARSGPAGRPGRTPAGGAPDDLLRRRRRCGRLPATASAAH